MSELIATAAMGYILMLFAVGISAARLLAGTEPLLDSPTWVRAAVGGLALGGPWLVYRADVLPVSDGPPAHAVVLTAVLGLWLAAERLFGITGRSDTGAC
jgi:hypothetical protein